MASIEFPIGGTDKPNRAGLAVASAEEILSGNSTIERNFQALPGSMVAFPHSDRYSQISASSRARASIWFLAACSLSAVDRLSGGPSIPTFTRPDSSPRDEENVNVNEPRPSGSNRIVSTLHTPPLRQTYALRL